jgi:hypothetical protein
VVFKVKQYKQCVVKRILLDWPVSKGRRMTEVKSFGGYVVENSKEQQIFWLCNRIIPKIENYLALCRNTFSFQVIMLRQIYLHLHAGTRENSFGTIAARQKNPQNKRYLC